MIVVVLGGASSGKSLVAQELAVRLPEPVTFIATAPPETLTGDDEMAAKVAAHQARRPSGWRTVEAGRDLVPAVASAEGTIVIDALGTWVAGQPDFGADAGELCRALTGRSGDSVVVSDEVGFGVHPSTAAGRRFRDVLGEVNQAVAAVADEVLLVVAGHALRLEKPDFEDVGGER